MLSHLKRKLYYCTACDLRFNTYEHFEKHKNLNHSLGYHNSQSEIYAEMNSELVEVAERPDTIPEEVEQQIATIDENDLSDENDQDDDNDQSEDYDDFDYDDGSDYEESLRKARRKCNRSKQRVRRKNSVKPKNPKIAFCTVCKGGFTTEKYLKIHMRIHDVAKTFSCKSCNKTFESRYYLKEHNKLHLDKKPFLCTECGMRFSRQIKLTEHLRVHTRNMPYACTLCGEQFSQGITLKTHKLSHIEEKFYCERCGKGFIKKSHLTRHKRTLHAMM